MTQRGNTNKTKAIMWNDAALTTTNGIITFGGKTPANLPFEVGLTKRIDEGCCVGAKHALAIDLTLPGLIPLTQLQNGFLRPIAALQSGVSGTWLGKSTIVNSEGKHVRTVAKGGLHFSATPSQNYWILDRPRPWIIPTESPTRGYLDVAKMLAAAVEPTAAIRNVALSGANNDMTFAAVPLGTLGNSVTIQFANPATPNAALSVTASGQDVVVHLATNGSSVVTSTANDVMAAVNASAAAAPLIKAYIADSNDGTGVVAALAKLALSGGVDAPSDRLALRSGPLWLWAQMSDSNSLLKFTWSPI